MKLPPTGKPVVFEMWAFPKKNDHVKTIYKEYKTNFEQPNSLQDVVQNLSDRSLTKYESPYATVFVPGGHGAMLGIPEDKNVREILNWAHESELFTITLCHGPGSLQPPLMTRNLFTKNTQWRSSPTQSIK